jgi:hypothetical protein
MLQINTLPTLINGSIPGPTSSLLYLGSCADEVAVESDLTISLLHCRDGCGDELATSLQTSLTMAVNASVALQLHEGTMHNELLL